MAQTEPNQKFFAGDILAITEPDNRTFHVMKLMTGEWWEIHPSGTLNGKLAFTDGDAAVQHARVTKALAEGRVTQVQEGPKPGELVALGIQTMALPDEAVLIQTATKGRYVKAPDGIINDTGVIISFNVIMPGSHIWEA